MRWVTGHDVVRDEVGRGMQRHGLEPRAQPAMPGNVLRAQPAARGDMVRVVPAHSLRGAPRRAAHGAVPGAGAMVIRPTVSARLVSG